jgi:excisionase family DNA binding protein
MSAQTMTPEDVRPMLTPAEAARLANVSRKTIDREVERGSLRALHVGGRLLRIDPTYFCRWLEGGTE